MIAAGGLSSTIAGGKFVNGFRQGVITSGLNHVAHYVIQKIDYRKELRDRFNKDTDGNYIVNPNGKPDLSFEGAMSLNKNVEGLEQAYNDGGKPNVRFDIKSDKYVGLTGFDDVNLNPSKITSNLKYAAVLFHEYRHAWQYFSGNYNYWAGKYGYAFVENYQERDAYWFQIKMGAGSFFEGYSRYIDYRNLTPKITYKK